MFQASRQQTGWPFLVLGSMIGQPFMCWEVVVGLPCRGGKGPADATHHSETLHRSSGATFPLATQTGPAAGDSR
ncbi:hypothetical protein B0H63DRAFT_194540 [Podospora didyma]|uniref:Uncharacterized protein n=1 Tax=Podospora didyma TaxID=330526 RepID=A0AAE0NG49_9PEZI|nr:hypothetical protein B0H63DRAFT_194540 [Podospora didyma]